MKISNNHIIFQEYQSNKTRIVLRRVEIISEGSYLCEVSVEALDLPDYGPINGGSQPRYNMNDILSANCTSYDSLPAAKISWYNNGEEATSSMLIDYPIVKNVKGLATSTLGLRYVPYPFN